jgi:DNA-binding MarR family transcriptional regulator
VSATRREPRGEDRTRWLSHLLWELSARLSTLGESTLTGTSLTMPALGLLQKIVERPGVTIAELARTGPRSAQALSQITARLERLGFIERRLATEGRGVALHLTEAGERARKRGIRIEADFETGLADELGLERYEQLCQLLEESRTIVERLEMGRPPTAIERD